MNPILQEIYKTGKVQDASGQEYQLDSSIDESEGELIRSIIEDLKFSRGLEVGCAYGLSSLWICDAFSKSAEPTHTMIDPFQSTDWHGVGVHNLRRAGFEFFNLIEKPSEIGLPALLEKGRTFQFALIDGWHTLDHTLLDFFYVDRMLEVGGVVVIDDVGMPGVRKVVRYVLNYPNYRLLKSANESPKKSSMSRRAVSAGVKSLGVFASDAAMRHVFAESCLNTDRSLGLECTMVALQKMGPDSRPWNWFSPF